MLEGVEHVYTSPYCIIHCLETLEPNSIPLEGSGIADCGTRHLVFCSGVFEFYQDLIRHVEFVLWRVLQFIFLSNITLITKQELCDECGMWHTWDN
jgi:hypothetical protein